MKRAMPWIFAATAVALAMGGAFFAWANEVVEDKLANVYDVAPLAFDKPPMAAAIADPDLGRRIVHVRNGCVDCHGSDLSGESIMEDPVMGTLHGPNITPATLGSWSAGEIARAIRHGIGRDGKPLVMMPSHEYQSLAASDLKSVVAYLRTVEPVDKENGPLVLGPLAKVLVALEELPTFLPAETIDHDRPFRHKPTEEPTARFGRYLAQTSCSGCHGPDFRGGPIPGGDLSWPQAPGLTRKDLGQWSADDFTSALKEGVNPAGRELRSPMPVALTAKMNSTEITALWKYFQTLPERAQTLTGPVAH